MFFPLAFLMWGKWNMLKNGGNTPVCSDLQFWDILPHQQLQPVQFISRHSCRGRNLGLDSNPVCSWNGCNALFTASCVCTKLWLLSVSKGWLQRDGCLLRSLCAAGSLQPNTLSTDKRSHTRCACYEGLRVQLCSWIWKECDFYKWTLCVWIDFTWHETFQLAPVK